VDAKGPDGTLRVGYQMAATLGAWSLRTRHAVPPSFSIEARVISSDMFWSTQAPMALDLRFGKFHWVWAPVEPCFENGRVTMKALGRPTIVREG